MNGADGGGAGAPAGEGIGVRRDDRAEQAPGGSGKGRVSQHAGGGQRREGQRGVRENSGDEHSEQHSERCLCGARARRPRWIDCLLCGSVFAVVCMFSLLRW